MPGDIEYEQSKVITNDQILLALFGMNTKELAIEIRKNKDGKYDRLYKKKGPIQREAV